MSEEVAARISADLASADPDRIRAALGWLDSAATDGTEIPVRAPELADLDRLDSVPEDLLLGFLKALWDYPFYEPEIGLDELYIRCLDAILLYGNDYSAYEFALHLKISPLPDLAVRIVLDALGGRLLPEGSSALRIAKHFVDFLLDGEKTRSSVVQALADARRAKRLETIIDHFRSAFTEAELARIQNL